MNNIETSLLVAFFLRRKMLKVISHNRYLDLGKSSKSFGTTDLDKKNCVSDRQYKVWN